jgi:DNA polymerase-1
MAQGLPLLLVIDGNSLLHRSHHALADSGDTDDAGRPVWALRGLVSCIAAAAGRLTPDGLLVGFDCTEHSVRRADYPAYKAHRADKPEPLVAQLAEAPRLLADAGVGVVVATGYEADDVLASSAATARRHGWRATLVTSDRDAFALIDPTTSVLRLLNGGLEGSPVITPRALPAVCGVDASQYRDLAALRGDSSDNLPGVTGIGGKTAAKLLAAFGSLDQVYAALAEGRADEVAAVVGGAVAARLSDPPEREKVERNRRLMAMRDDLELPDLAALRLPLDGARMRSALHARGIRLGPSLWALLGQPPPAWLQAGYDHAPGYLPRAQQPHVPPPPAQPPAPIGSGEPDDTRRHRLIAEARGHVRRAPGRSIVVPEDQLSLF